MKLIYGFILFTILFTVLGFLCEDINNQRKIDAGNKSFEQRNGELMCRIFKTDWYFNHTHHDIFTIYYNRISCIPYYLTYNSSEYK
jgi:hypothetical protein